MITVIDMITKGKSAYSPLIPSRTSNKCIVQYTWPWVIQIVMTSSNGKIFRVTGHLCGEFTGDRWIPHTKASDICSAQSPYLEQCVWFIGPLGIIISSELLDKIRSFFNAKKQKAVSQMVAILPRSQHVKRWSIGHLPADWFVWLLSRVYLW